MNSLNKWRLVYWQQKQQSIIWVEFQNACISNSLHPSLNFYSCFQTLGYGHFLEGLYVRMHMFRVSCSRHIPDLFLPAPPSKMSSKMNSEPVGVLMMFGTCGGHKTGRKQTCQTQTISSCLLHMWKANSRKIWHIGYWHGLEFLRALLKPGSVVANHTTCCIFSAFIVSLINSLPTTHTLQCTEYFKASATDTKQIYIHFFQKLVNDCVKNSSLSTKDNIWNKTKAFYK